MNAYAERFVQPDRHVAGLRSIRRRAVAAGLINEYHHTA
jgi:hypothetical protein